MELLRDIGVFLWAVINSWAGYCTGGAIVALLWLWSTMKQQTIPRQLGILLAALFLAVAIFNAWRDQKQKADLGSREIAKLERQIADLAQSSFAMQIDFAILGAQPSGSHAGLIVTLTNSGASSSVLPDSWKLHAITDDARSFEGWPNTLKDKNLDFCLSPKSLMRFARSDALYQKASAPVERNGYQQGFLWFGLPSLPREKLIAPTTRLVVEAQSVTGQKFQTQITVEELQRQSTQQTKFFAGISNPSPISAPCVENNPY